MTEGIVFWLREFDERNGYPKCSEAAAEIERLRAGINEIKRLRAALRLLIEWHDDTGAVMLPVLIDVARAALEGGEDQ
jgi:hypothetical protein